MVRDATMEFINVSPRRLGWWLALAAALLQLVTVSGCAQDYQRDADRLASLLNWHTGSVVADVGAGRGEMTMAAARRVGSGGRVYASELDAGKLAHLEELAAKRPNVTALRAGVSETNLPQACCDSIFMRLVYHHLTRPAAIDASLFKALKPNGLLAIIDEEPKPGSTIVTGVPANRGGHGVPEKIVIQELTGAGFQTVKTFDSWPDEHYCVIFRKYERKSD